MRILTYGQEDSQSLGSLPCLRTWQRACRIWFALFGNSQGVVEGQYFYQATQNGAQTAVVSAHQSKMHILKSSGFWFHNIITHWGYPGKGVQKSNQNQNVEAKNRESNWMFIITINWDLSINHDTTIHLLPLSVYFRKDVKKGCKWQKLILLEMTALAVTCTHNKQVSSSQFIIYNKLRTIP